MTALLVLGNAALDIGLPIPRLPHRGETLVGGARTTAPGGKGLNQAVAAQRTGLVPVHLFAPLGQDRDADLVEAALRQEGFAGLHLPRLPGATDCSVLLVLPDGENCIVSAGDCAAALPAADAAQAVQHPHPVMPGLVPGIHAAQPGRSPAAGRPEISWLLMQGNLSQAATMAAARAARAGGMQVMLNTAPLCWDATPLLPLCDLVVANEGEARAVTGHDGAEAAEALRGPGAAIITLGSAGCLVATASGVRTHPAILVAAIDTTGAGDAFCGVLAACLAAGWTLEAALVPAQRAAALTVQRPGAFAALPSRAELASLLA